MSDSAAKPTRQQVEDDLQEARARHREAETRRTITFQQEQFDFVAGPPRRYLGFKFDEDGTVIVTSAEYTIVVSTTRLTREEATGMVSSLQNIL